MIFVVQQFLFTTIEVDHLHFENLGTVKSPNLFVKSEENYLQMITLFLKSKWLIGMVMLQQDVHPRTCPAWVNYVKLFSKHSCTSVCTPEKSVCVFVCVSQSLTGSGDGRRRSLPGLYWRLLDCQICSSSKTTLKVRNIERNGQKHTYTYIRLSSNLKETYEGKKA